MEDLSSYPSLDGQAWNQSWEEGKTDWHIASVEPLLTKYVDLLVNGREGVSILVTMCGKSVDMIWLCERGFSVTGVEISPLPVRHFFEENSIPYTVDEVDDFTEYSASDRSIKLYCGDIFKFLPSAVGQFDAIWDCNALVAVNMDQRQQYADLLISLLRPKGRILMTTWDYEQRLHMDLPFSVDVGTVDSLFDPRCSVQHLESVDMGRRFYERHGVPNAKRPVILLSKK